MRISLAGLTRTVSALFLLSAPTMAADLDLVSTVTFESGGRRYIQPCVHNNTGELREAHFKVGNHAVRWAFRPLPVAAGQTACYSLDAPPIVPGIPNEVNVE